MMNSSEVKELIACDIDTEDKPSFAAIQCSIDVENIDKPQS